MRNSYELSGMENGNVGYTVYPKLLLARLAEIGQRTLTGRYLLFELGYGSSANGATCRLLALATSAPLPGINTMPVGLSPER